MLHGGEIYGQKIEYDFSVNLNPNPCPIEVRQALISAASCACLYPDIKQTAFRKAIALSEGGDIKASNIIGGNGASELFVSVLRYLNPRRVLIPVPSFYGYVHALNMLPDCKIEEYMLLEEKDFLLDNGFIDSIDEDIDAIIIANPNNPTGRCIDSDILFRILDKCRKFGIAIIIDECFLKMSCGESAKKYIGKIPKLFIINAYTKLFSIPGVRVGYAIADDKDIEGIIRYLPEWNFSVFAQHAGIACANILSTDDFVRESMNIITSGREQLTRELISLDIKVFFSDTNFILIHTDKDIFTSLKKQGILIRDCSNFKGLKDGYYRIAVKNVSDNRELLNIIKACL